MRIRTFLTHKNKAMSKKNQTSFAPGKSGNATGRPKRTAEEMDLITACKAKTPAALIVIEELMKSAKMDSTRLQAAMAIIERAWGKPVQPTDNQHSGEVSFTWITQ